MSIVSSAISSDSAQSDGRRWIREIHIDHVGVKWERNYEVPNGYDTAQALAAYAIILLANIKDAEINKNISNVLENGSQAIYTLIYSTAAENFAALRVAYQTSTKREAIMIGDFLSSLTTAQLQNAFGITSGQVTTLRANKLTPAASAATTIRNATGA